MELKEIPDHKNSVLFCVCFVCREGEVIEIVSFHSLLRNCDCAEKNFATKNETKGSKS